MKFFDLHFVYYFITTFYITDYKFMEDFVKQSNPVSQHLDKLPSPSLGENFPKLASEPSTGWSAQYTPQAPYASGSAVNCSTASANDYHHHSMQQQYHHNNPLSVSSAKYWS